MGKIDMSKLGEKIYSKIPDKFKPFADKLKKRSRLVKRIVIAAAIVFIVFFIYERIKWHGIIKVSGVIEGDDVRVSFRVEGKILELLADEGYLLEEGQIVAKLDTDELSKERDKALASLIRAERQMALDEIDYVRAENLYKEGAISQQERDARETAFGTDKAIVDREKAALLIAETRLGWSDLASPLDGYVILKSSLQGEVVQVGEPVFTVIDLHDIWVTAYINESDLGKVKLNQKAFIMTDSYKLKKYDGWVSFISQQAEFTPKYIQTTEERVKYVYRIKVRVDNSSLDFKPGMPADAYIITG
ncbi:MAG: efflux RND transporter periplasmic adaptor subunit [Candidatus Omnitrophota bacterium]